MLDTRIKQISFNYNIWKYDIMMELRWIRRPVVINQTIELVKTLQYRQMYDPTITSGPVLPPLSPWTNQHASTKWSEWIDVPDTNQIMEFDK